MFVAEDERSGEQNQGESEQRRNHTLGPRS
jgi:hypothetical protein